MNEVRIEKKDEMCLIFTFINPEQRDEISDLVASYFEEWGVCRVIFATNKGRWRVSVDTDYERFTVIENNLVDAIKNLSVHLKQRKI